MRPLVLALALLAVPAWADPAQRVLSLGGSITETVFAMGLEARLIGRDATSTHPQAALALPDVGYLRQLSPEGVLSVAPDLILAEPDVGPPETVAILEGAGIPFRRLPADYTAEGVLARIRAVGAALAEPDRAAALEAQVGAELAAAAQAAAAVPQAQRRRVLFVLSASGGGLLVSGQGTAADGIIALAGAVNAVQGVQGYKPLTDEALEQAAPDLILMMTRGGEHALSDAALFALPAVRLTPAGRNRAVLRMDGLLLLGFGPRTGQAALELHRAVYGE